MKSTTLALAQGQSAANTAAPRRSLPQAPVPMRGIAAARRPRLALAAYLAVHHRAALTLQPQVRLPKALMIEFGVTKDAKARALHASRRPDSCVSKRQRGRQPKVTLIR